MRLIVGLGNPGIAYVWTPHNLGFLAADCLAEMSGIRLERPEAKSLVGRGQLAGQDVVLAKPQTMMNLSGMAVSELLRRYELGPDELIVLCDEVQLPWGMIRVNDHGSAGTHNGMKSVIGALALLLRQRHEDEAAVSDAQKFCRVRMGVQPEHAVDDLAAYVLRPMRRAQQESAAEMVEQAAEAVKSILTEGVARTMNRFNRRASPAPPEAT
jgi:peptidyl-tRNA hydrolase, PTH1 family